MTKFGAVFLVVLLGSAVAAAAVPARGRSLLHLDRGVIANERLTALVGALLFALLVAVAVSTLSMPGFLPEHYIVGLLLGPPVVLTLAATGYRFAPYYTRSVAYRLAGPPPVLMRLVVAPLLLASTLAVFATGIELWLFGLRFGSGWMTAHTLSAVVLMLAAGGPVLCDSVPAVCRGPLGTDCAAYKTSPGSVINPPITQSSDCLRGAEAGYAGTDAEPCHHLLCVGDMPHGPAL